ncbi:MAG: STAS domain-containing protein [Acidimicrobiia bacterium]
MEQQTVFSCSIERRGGHVALGVIGEIDHTSAGQFRNQLLTIAKEHPTSIDIDMAGVVLDSSCVAVLVEAWRFAQDHRIELTVTSPCAAVARTFDMAPSGQLLNLHS